MGDGKVRRIAVILNGDTEERHLQNVERAAKLLGEKGYDLYVASPKQPQGKTAIFEAPTKKGIEEILKRLAGKLDDDDEILIYTTGHGGDQAGGCLVLKDTCLAKEDPVFKRLFSLPYGKRTIVMSQCYGGNWARLYINDPKTLFVSAGSKGEKVCCQLFDPLFFSADKAIKDANGDGTISWSERYRFTLSHEQAAISIFLAGPKYKDTGIGVGKEERSHFEPRLYEAGKFADYKKLLESLKPGDIAITMVSASWCYACKLYLPIFKKLARETGGRVLFVYIPEVDDELRNALNINRLPSVFLADHLGRHILLENRDDPLAERWKLVGAQWSDFYYCLKQIVLDASAMQYVDPGIRKDPYFIFEAVKLNPQTIKYVDPQFKKDKKNIAAAMLKNGLALQFLEPAYKKDFTIVLAAVAQNSAAWQFADPKLLADEKFIRSAAKFNGMVLQFVPETFKKDRKFVLETVKESGMALQFADPELIKEKEICLAAVKNDGLALEFADPELQKNEEIVFEAVKQNGLALEFADPLLRKKRRIVLAAVKQKGTSLKFASPDLKKDKTIVLTAIDQDGSTTRVHSLWGYDWAETRSIAALAFQFAPLSLKKDREIVLTAVERDGLALELADAKLKKDRKVVLTAVKQNGLALEYAASELKKDREIVLGAVKQNREAIEHADPSIRNDPELLQVLKGAK